MNDQSLGRFRKRKPVASGDQWIGSRKRQEDAFETLSYVANGDEEHLFCIVCDGMGGHVGGKVASETAVQAAVEAVQNPNVSDVASRLRDALTAANRAVGNKVRDTPDLKGMGSTFVGLILRDRRMHWISVGDSPMWVATRKDLRRLNVDHSLRTQLEDQARRGEITMEQARSHPNRNALTSAVMGDQITLYDLNDAPIDPESRIIIASDGIETLDNGEIHEIARAHLNASPKALQQALIQAVKERRKAHQDNTTIVVIDPVPESQKTAVPLQQQLPPWIYAGAGGVVVLVVMLALWMIFGRGAPAPDPAVQDPSTVTQVQPPPAQDCIYTGLDGIEELCACAQRTGSYDLDGFQIAEDLRQKLEQCKIGDEPNFNTAPEDPVVPAPETTPERTDPPPQQSPPQRQPRPEAETPAPSGGGSDGQPSEPETTTPSRPSGSGGGGATAPSIGGSDSAPQIITPEAQGGENNGAVQTPDKPEDASELAPQESDPQVPKPETAVQQNSTQGISPAPDG